MANAGGPADNRVREVKTFELAELGQRADAIAAYKAIDRARGDGPESSVARG